MDKTPIPEQIFNGISYSGLVFIAGGVPLTFVAYFRMDSFPLFIAIKLAVCGMLFSFIGSGLVAAVRWVKNR